MPLAASEIARQLAKSQRSLAGTHIRSHADLVARLSRGREQRAESKDDKEERKNTRHEKNLKNEMLTG